jgi:hypothetical protein
MSIRGGHVFADALVRFITAGLVVSGFAVLGTALRPKSFAGVFGAAPAVALASLVFIYVGEGADHVAQAGRSMMAGGVALAAYSLAVRWLLPREWAPTSVLVAACWMIWLIVAIGLWARFLR